MLNDVENPMVTGAGYAEPKPDFTCPNCGSKWYNEDISGFSVSAARQYCGDCYTELDTPERRQVWFDGENKEHDSLALVYMISPYTHETLANGIDAKALLAWIKTSDADGYADALADYIHMDCYRNGDYRQWLMDNN